MASLTVFGPSIRVGHLAWMLAWCILVLPTAARAQTRDEVIHLDIRLMAADLVDELVYSWVKEAPLAVRSPLVLTEVSAPLGLDERFGVTVENRLFEVVQKNPEIHLELVHCAPCLAWVGKSTPQGTILGRGFSQPETLASLHKSTGDLYGLSLRFEAEHRELILRAQIFRLSPPQPIVWSKTLATSMSARRLLRDPAPLISLEAAREEQRMVLERRDPLEISTRVVIRNFNTEKGAPLTAIPLPFVEQSFEAVPTPWRRHRVGLTFGFSSIQNSLAAFSVGGHYAGLLYGKKPSLIWPDLYFVLGSHFVRMRGPGAAAFSAEQPDLERLRGSSTEPKASLVMWRLGLELHMKHRLGLMAFLENVPMLRDSRSVRKEDLLGIPYHVYGMGLVIRW